MMASLKALLLTTRDVYAAGVKNPNICLIPENLQDDSTTSIPLPGNDKALLDRCARFRKAGLLAARKGELAIADHFFREEHLLLHSEKLCPESFLAGNSAHEAAVAYFDYRCNNLEKAITRIHNALEADEILENKYGYTILHMHRIRLVLNLMRLNSKRMHVEKVINIGFQVLNYLEGKSKTLPILTSWDDTRLADQSRERITMMFELATAEIAYALASREIITTKNKTFHTRDLFTGAAYHIQPGNANECYLSTRAHKWLQMKRALVENDLVDFLRQIIQMLSDRQIDMSLFWYASILDLLLLCKKINLPEADLIQQDIVKDAKLWEWKYLPHSWRIVLE